MPASSWKKKGYDIDEIARRLEAKRGLEANGKIVMKGGMEELESVLLSAIDWNSDLVASEIDSIAFGGFFEAAKHGPVTSKSLLKAIRTLEREKLAVPDKEFVLVATLSVPFDRALHSLTVRGVKISFHDRLSKRFKREQIAQQLVWRNMEIIPKGYCVVCAKVNSRSPEAAANKALIAVGILRALWNFAENWKTPMRRTYGAMKTTAINQIRLGPVQTVHNVDGSLATDAYWYEPKFEYQDPKALTDWPAILRNSKKLYRRFKLLTNIDEADEMLLRYVQAFDTPDLEGTLLRLWSLLEMLTATFGGPYDKTIERVLFVCRDRVLHKLILQHLRDVRNTFVHKDQSRSDVEQQVFQLKGYIETLIQLRLAWAKRFESMQEVGDFLSLHHNPAALRRDIKEASFALKFQLK